jgi:hypothetical protein
MKVLKIRGNKYVRVPFLRFPEKIFRIILLWNVFEDQLSKQVVFKKRLVSRINPSLS